MARKRSVPKQRGPKLSLEQKRFEITYALITRGAPKEFIQEGVAIAMERIKVKRTTVAEAIEFVMVWINRATDKPLI